MLWARAQSTSQGSIGTREKSKGAWGAVSLGLKGRPDLVKPGRATTEVDLVELLVRRPGLGLRPEREDEEEEAATAAEAS